MTVPPFEITLADKVVSLEVNSKAMLRIGSYFDGFIPAHNAVRGLDVAAYRRIIAAGTNKPLADNDGLEDAIFATGLVEMQEPLFKYLDLLVTGGRGTPKPEVSV